MRTSPRYCGSLLIALVLIATCCSGSAETVDAVDAQATRAEIPNATETSGGLEGDFSIVGALSEIPVSATILDETVEVSVANIDAISAMADLERPPCCPDLDTTLSFWGPMTGAVPDGGESAGVYVAMPQWMIARSLLDPEPMRDEFGFWPGELARFAHLEMQTADFTVATGLSQPTGLPEVAQGVWSVGEGEDFRNDIANRTPARPLGRPFRVAARGNRVAISLVTDPVVDWASDTPGPSLANDSTLLPMAERLDDHDVLSAVLLMRRKGDDLLFERADPWTYEGVGVGWAVDGDGPLGVIALTYETNELAQQELAGVEATFVSESRSTGASLTELITLERIDVQESTIVALVRYPPGRDPITLLNLVWTADGPFE